MIYNMTGGAGGGLKLYVKAYSTSAEMTADTPKENTIGVVTSSMTAYKISEKQPAHSAGLVFIKLGTDNRTYMDADKHSTLTIHPIRAQISDGSTWTNITMMIYKDGAWSSQWYVFAQNSLPVESVSLNNSTRASWTTNGLELNTQASSNNYTTAYKQIDITNYRTIRAKVYTNIISSLTTLSCKLAIASAHSDVNSIIKSVDMKPSSAGTAEYTLDISSNVGTVYVEIYVRGNANYANAKLARVTEWRLEP